MTRGAAHGVNKDVEYCGEKNNYDDPNDDTKAMHDEIQTECDEAKAEEFNIPDRPYLAELPYHADRHGKAAVYNIADRHRMTEVPNQAGRPRVAKVPNLAERHRMAEVRIDRPDLGDRPHLVELHTIVDQPYLATLPNLADRPSLAELPNLADNPSLKELPNLAHSPSLEQLPNIPELSTEHPDIVELPNTDDQPILAKLPYIAELSNIADNDIEQQIKVRNTLIGMSEQCNHIYSDNDLDNNIEAPEYTETALLLRCGEAGAKINDDKLKTDIDEDITNKDMDILFEEESRSPDKLKVDIDGNKANQEMDIVFEEESKFPDNLKDDTDEDKTHQDMDIVIEEESKVPDGGWGWFIVIGALLLRLIIGGLGRSHGLFYIKFLDRFGGTATATSLVTSLTGLFRVGFGPLVSVLCTRFPCRYLTLVGACLLVTGLIMTGFAPSLPFLYISYGAICGLGRAFVLTPVPILLGDYFNKRRSLAFGLASTGFSLGGLGITPVVEILFQTYGLQGTFLLLGGFALNMLVCAALFRPIELHRKITSNRSKTQSLLERREMLIVSSIEDIHSGQVLNSSTISIEAHKIKKRSDTIINEANTHINGEECSDLNVTSSNRCSCNGDSVIGSDKHCNENKFNTEVGTEEEETPKKKKKKQLIAWSILKDVRFLCLCFSSFLITLPSGGLFLPALAKARGASDIQAAALVSINAGSDTVIRVLSGFVLDMRIFRRIRPHIYSAVIVIQGLVTLMYPLMNSYPAFVMLCAADGFFTGLKAAQSSVVVMDILGVDKLASSMAITMSVQAVAIIIGPTVSGRLKDISGVYDGAFYFGGTAIILAGLVMAGGIVRKHIVDKRKASRQHTAEEQSLTNMT